MHFEGVEKAANWNFLHEHPPVFRYFRIRIEDAVWIQNMSMKGSCVGRVGLRSLRGKGRAIKKEATPCLPHPHLTRGAADGAEPPRANLGHHGRIVNIHADLAAPPQPG